jgi:nucleoside-diphosphate-sugar epimerase
VIRADRGIVDGQVFNVGVEHENYTKRMIVTQLQEVIPKSDIRFREGRMDPRNYRVSFQKIGERLGFRPRTSLGSFIRELAEAVERGEYPASSNERAVYTNDAPLGYSQ